MKKFEGKIPRDKEFEAANHVIKFQRQFNSFKSAPALAGMGQW